MRKSLIKKNSLFWMDSIIDKMIAYGLEAMNKPDAYAEIHRKTKFPQSVMVWLGACYDGVTRPVIIETGTINH